LVKYLQALDDGEIPIRVLFSGTVFTKAAAGFAVEQAPCFEALHRFRGLRALPTWEDTIDTLLKEARVGELS
jgi:hypothetical protein